MVVMEFLDAGDGWQVLWQRHSQLSGDQQEQSALLEAVRTRLGAAHAVRVQHSGGLAATVHGDMRGPNIFVRRTDKWEVRFVDLDWAGIAGEGRYPPAMSDSIPWHAHAQPGQVVQQEHDVHLLNECGTRA
jgi:hypothetical protein